MGKMMHHPELQWTEAGAGNEISQRSAGFAQMAEVDFWADKTPHRQGVAGGIIPGYTGHQPRVKDVAGESPFGGSKVQPGESSYAMDRYEQGNRGWKDAPMMAKEKYTFREDMNGIIPGYKGHRRNAKDHMFSSAYGGLPKGKSHPRPGSGVDVSSRAQTTTRGASPELSQRGGRASPARAPSPRSGSSPARASSPRSGSPARGSSPRTGSPGRSSSPRGRSSSPRSASPKPKVVMGRSSSERGAQPKVVLAKAATQRDRSLEGDRPHRQDRRAVVPGSTFHVPRSRDVVATSTCG